MKKDLFEETNIGSMKLKNRFIRTACGDSHGVNGHIKSEDIDLYKELSNGNIGAIITGYTYISDYGMSEDIGMFGIYDDSFIEEYKELTNAVHNNDGKIIMQLVHLGSATLMKNVRVIAPSEVENTMTKTIPEEMTREEIKKVQEDFVKAGIRVKESSFDGIELHAAHNFLLNQFISPHYNKRTDEYGGCLGNRARFITEVIQDMRKTLGNDYPIIVKVQSEEIFDDGITKDEFLYYCKELEKSGASSIDVSGVWMSHKEKTPYFEDIATELANSISIPVILTGGIRDIKTANHIIKDTNISYIGMCRPFINNPNLVKEWSNGESTKSDCISCGACSRTHKCILRRG